jgi:Spy/CpxP family protein refolding chaperone
MKTKQKFFKLFVFFALVLSFLAFSPVSYGFNGMHKKMNHYGPMKFGKFFKLAKILHLSKFQIRKLRKLNSKGFKKMMKTRRMMQGRKMMQSPMLAAVKNGTFNKAAYEFAALQNIKFMLKMRAARMENFYNILTPQQKKEFLIILKIKRGDWSWNNGK